MKKSHSKLILFLIFQLTSKTKEREIYLCSENSLLDSQCLDQQYLGSNLINFLTKCTEGKICQSLITSNENNKIGMCITKKRKLMHREPCRANIQCSSNYCEMKKCVGYSLNRKCDPNRYQCIKGLICSYDTNLNYYTCQKPKNKNDNCIENYDCPLGTICSISSIDNYNNKKCIEIGSVKIGEKASLSLACESGDLYNGICVRKGEIISECGLNGNEKNICDIEIISTGTTVKKINCLFTSLGAYICPDKSIEEKFLIYLNEYNKNVKNIKQENFLIEKYRFTLNKFDVSKKFFEYNYWNLVYDADDCAYQYFFTVNSCDCIKFCRLFLVILIIIIL